MIVYAQPQNLEAKCNEDYHQLQLVSGSFFARYLTDFSKWIIIKLSIFTKIGFRTQHSCFIVENSVVALVIALLQGV